MFYEIFKELCDERGIKPGPAAEACGINRSNVSLWKSRGYTPRGEKLQAIADYFGVSTDYLLGKKEQKEKPLINGDEGLTEYLEELRTRPEMKMLFKLTKGATKADVEKAVKIIETMLEKSGFGPVYPIRLFL